MNVADIVEQLRTDEAVVDAYDTYVNICHANGQTSIFSFRDFVTIATGRALHEFIHVLQEREALHNLGMDHLLGEEGNTTHTALIAVGSGVLAMLAIDAGFREADFEMREKIRKIGEAEQL